MPLKYPTRIPPGGIQFFIPQIGPNGWSLPNPLSQTLESATRAVQKIVVANPRFPFPRDFKTIFNMIDAYNCHRLKNDPAWCSPQTGDEPKKSVSTASVRPLPVPRPGGAVVQAVAKLAEKASHITAGIRTLFDWWGDGGRPVKHDTACFRSGACFSCPHNVKGDWTTRVTGAVAEAILEQRRAKTELALTVPNEELLGTCDVCECHLPLKIWVPLSNIEKQIKGTTWANLPDTCWMKIEAKRPIVVIPYHPGDIDQARMLLNWMEELGGCLKHRCLLVSAIQVPETRRNELITIAERAFAEVDCITTPRPIPGEKWPGGANYMFKTAAEYLQDSYSPFWWNEPDCIPLKSEWLDELESDYRLGGKPFMGAVMPSNRTGTPSHFLSGCAIYPPGVINMMTPFLKLTDCKPCDSWDVASGDVVVPQAANSLKVQNFWGQANLAPVFVPELPASHAENALPLSFIHRGAVVFHRCKDGSLIRVLSKKKVELTHPRLDLSRVTLFSVWWNDACEQFDRTVQVLNYCQKLFKFDQVVLFSYAEPRIPTTARVVKIPKLDWNQYNAFVNHQVPKHISSEFAMSVHEDGFPLEPELWKEEFLQYDYIGAPWTDGIVGNGGFNIESQKLLQLKVNLPGRPEHSDMFICRTHRAALQSAGVKFAPANIAQQFSTETTSKDQRSFGFHGKQNVSLKYNLGWSKISSYYNPTVEVVYIFVANNESYKNQAINFLDSYRKNPPGAPHKTTIVCNCGQPGPEMARAFQQLPNCTLLMHDNSGYDIGGFQHAARISTADVILFLGGSTYFNGAGWLKRVVGSFLKYGNALYGTMGNRGDPGVGVNRHIRTTAFWMTPRLLNEYPITVTELEQRYQFEHRRMCFTEWVLQRGLKALVVGWQGEYEWADWDSNPNGFHRGNQSNLMIGDHISRPPFYPPKR